MPTSAEMKDHVYKILELVGSSEKSIDDAIRNAVTRASKTIRDMKWFEVVQTRGHIEKGSVAHYQVTLRVGFTLERGDSRPKPPSAQVPLISARRAVRPRLLAAP
jgi:Uncharacterized conserved protein